MAAKRKQKTQIKRAREFDCAGCGADLSAVPTRVANPFDADRKPITQLRAPPRCIVTFQFSGYVPARESVTRALCDNCQKTLTFTSAGIPLMINLDDQKIEAAEKLNEFQRELAALVKKFE